MNIQDIEINKIKQIENIRLRIKEKDVHTLMASIKQDGLLEPIGVSYIPGKKEEFYCVYGNRRLEACRKLGWMSIPANILPKLDLKDFLVTNTLENVERQELSESEMGRMFNVFIKEYNMTITEIASRFRIPSNRVKRCIGIFTHIPEKYRNDVQIIKTANMKRGRIPATTADTIINIRRKFNLNKEQVEQLLDEGKKDGFEGKHMDIVGSLLQRNYSVEDAIACANKYKIIHLSLPILSSDIKRLTKKHNKNIIKIINSILRGELKETIDVASFKQ